MPAKFTPAELDHAVALYVAGCSPDEVREQTGIASSSLYRAMTVRNVATRPRAHHAPDGLVREFLAGDSVKALSARYGVARSAIVRMLREAGVQQRDRSQAMFIRMASTDEAERLRLAGAAHDAVRGKTQLLASRIKGARTREARQSSVSPAELLMGEWLSKRGVRGVVAQQAVGPYNVDVGAFPVAVEIFGGGWHGYGRHKERSAKRYRYILDEGWTVVVVWVNQRRHPLSIAAADYIAAHFEVARRDESVRGEYRVIRGDGQEMSSGRDDLDQLTRVPTLH